MINFEGGAIPEEYRVEYVVDRVETTATVLLGLTMGCARATTTSTIPITQKEFYRFFAFFNNVPRRGSTARKGNAAPMLELPHRRAGAARRVARSRPSRSTRPRMPRRTPTSSIAGSWQKTRLEPLPERRADGLLAHYAFDGIARRRRGRSTGKRRGFERRSAAASRLDFDGETHVDGARRLKRDALRIGVLDRGATRCRTMTILAGKGPGSSSASRNRVPSSTCKRGSPLYVRVDARPRRVGDSAQTTVYERTTCASRTTAPASRLAPSLYVDGKPAPVDARRTAPAARAATAPLAHRRPHARQRRSSGDVGDLRVYDRALTAAEAADPLAARARPRHPGASPSDKRTDDAEAARLRDYYRDARAPPTLAQASTPNWTTCKQRRPS